MAKKALSVMFAFILLISFTGVNKVLAADDITGNALEKEMRAMVERNVMQGFGQGRYEPNLPVTRGQFATFIKRAVHLPEGTGQFTDVASSSKLAPGIYSAYQAGIVEGFKDGSFHPDENITREQAAVMILRTLEYLDIHTPEGELAFSDKGQINEKFKRAVAVNADYKIIQGLKNADGSYRFEPKNNATRAHAAAFISRMLTMVEAIEDEEKPPAEETGFKISTIRNGELVPGAKSYTSFDQAASAITNAATQVVTHDGHVVKMNAGIAYARPRVDNILTVIYDSTLKTQLSYVVATSELKYLDADEHKVKVEYAGNTGYVKHNEVTLVPYSLVEGRSYYYATNGDLYHYIYQNNSKSYVRYYLGPAPSFMKASTNYYSWDGANFTTDKEDKQKAGTEYQYYQNLPIRTETSYTAEELNQHIKEALAEREKLYAQNNSVYAKYKDAATKSKLLDLGEHLKKVEAEHKVNALFILALAMHESDFGISPTALAKNNLFGIKVYDNSPEEGEKYSTPQASIDALVKTYLNKNYIPPNAAHANGAAPGNKAAGVNTKYASDPYWGSKVSGHMYRIDKALGGKDYGKYQIGMTTAAGLNIRPTAGTSGSALFTYVKSGLPVVILDTVKNDAGETWYKIISDDVRYQDAYVRNDFMKVLPIVGK